MSNTDKTGVEILIVDDDRIICLLQKQTLARLDLKVPVHVFQNGKEALDYIERHKEEEKEFLILLDINMPEMNGWDFLDCTQKKEYAAQLYVTMVTSSVNNSDRRKAETYPQVIGYYEKLFDKEKAEDFSRKRKVQELLDQEVGEQKKIIR